MREGAKKFTVNSIMSLGDGKFVDPTHPGLYLWVRSKGASRVWQFRYNLRGKPYTIALGSVRKVSLAEARVKVADYRAMVAQGRPPSKGMTAARATLGSTLVEDTDAFFERERRGWDEAHSRIWLRSMQNHILPTLGARDTASVTAQDIVDVLTPLWLDRHETGLRLHGRLRAVIGHAIKRAHASRQMERFRFGNPADLALDLMPTLAARAPEPHRALPWQSAPALYRRLVELDDRVAYALRFLLLTCTPRTAEVVQAHWEEIDLSDTPFGDVWHVPSNRVKGAVARDVPLSRPAVDLLTAIQPQVAEGYIFRANRKGRTVDGVFIPFAGHMQHDAMNILLRELGIDSTVHGTRSMFRGWVTANALSVIDHDAAEIALDHKIGSRVARAYDRGDLLVARRDLAERWAQFLMAG
jgi:integrase